MHRPQERCSSPPASGPQVLAGTQICPPAELSTYWGSQQIGGELKLAANTTVKFTAWLRSFVPVDHLQIVCDGEIVRELPLAPARQSANVTGDIAMDKSGWCLLRALSDKSEFPVLDSFPYATTGPIYVDVAGKPQVHGKDAAYFVAWIDRLVDGAENNSAWNTAEEKQIVMKLLQDARAVYAGKAR